MQAHTAEEFLKFVSEEVGHEVRFETSIEELDVDSLEFIELVQAISEKFGPVSDSKIKQLCTVSDLYNAIQTSSVQG